MINSILKDFKSWEKIKENNWHLHAPIAYFASILLYWYIGYSIIDIYAVSSLLLKIAIPTFLGTCFCWIFERAQQLIYFKEPMSYRQSFESDKDFLVGSFFCFLGTLTGYFIL